MSDTDTLRRRVRSALWDHPVKGCRGPTIVRLQGSFRAALLPGSRTLPLEQAQALATRLLKANRADSFVVERAVLAVRTKQC